MGTAPGVGEEQGSTEAKPHEYTIALIRLRDLAAQVAGSPDPDASLQLVVNALVELHGARSGTLSVYDPCSGVLRRAAAAGFEPAALASLANTELGPAAGPGGFAFARGSRQIVADTENDSRFDGYGDAARAAGFRAVHCTPVVNGSAQTVGVISVYFEAPRTPTQLETLLADLCARHAAGVIETSRAQRALQESERRYRHVIESLPAAVYATDPRGCLTLYNAAAVELWGRTPETGQEYWCGSHRMYWPDGSSLPLNQCPMALALQRGQSLEGMEAVIERPDGTRRNVLAHPRMIHDSRGRLVGAINVLVDITERKGAERIQERLREAQRLESIGLLAGGIAHDFNNILVGVLGNACIAGDMVGDDSPVSPVLKEIEIAAERAAHLTRQMLAYAGKTHFVIEPVELSGLVRETLELIRSTLSPRIIVRTDLSTLVRIQADRSQVQQVIMNLMINAAEAIGADSGSISIKTSLRTIEQAEEAPAGSYVCLEVRDTGCGMDERTRQRIFDPFFTTKFTGRGLGLAAVAGVIRGHQGSVRVESAPLQGSTFTVLFPSVVPVIADAGAERAFPKAPSVGSVLVVDDEPVVLRTAKLGLERHGFRVLDAGSGREALERIEREGAGVDLLLLDVTMAGMSGNEVLLEIERRGLRFPVLVSSGYPESEVLRELAGRRVAGFIQKPYTPARLAAAISGILRESTPLETRDPVRA